MIRAQEILVSVIVPCYNQCQFLPDALTSIKHQKFQNWECIIVNDGSTDATREISESWCKADTRFRYIEKANGGLSSARNYGIKNSNGKYILPLDADDIIHANYLNSAIKHFEKFPETKLVYCEARKFGLLQEKWHLERYSYELLLTQNIIFCSSIYRKSDYYTCSSGYDEDMLNGYEDWEFWIQLLEKNDVVYQIPKEFFYYRIKERSTIFTNEYFEVEKRKYIFVKHINKYLNTLPDPIHLAQQNKMLNALYKNSYSYKLGYFLLTPVKIILSIFSSKIR